MNTPTRLTPGQKFSTILFTGGLAGAMFFTILALCFALAGCAVQAPPVVTPPVVLGPDVGTLLAAGNDCTSLWRDELGRDIDLVAYNECSGFVAQGIRSIEEYRSQIRATDEYAAYRARLEAEKVPALSRLRLAGRHGLVNASGAKVPWTAVTGFRLVEQVAHGRQGEAAAFLDGIGPARGVRVLLMARWLFQLSPDEGLAALTETLDLTQRHGRYLEVTIFADTKAFGLGRGDYQRIADRVGGICASHVACAMVEIANEVWPLHDTQADILADLTFLRELRAAVRAYGDIPVSLGSTHADQDESDRMRDGDYLTIHGARDDGDDGWRWVRHSNEQRALADRVERWTVNDEPRRDDLDCGRQVGMGLLARLFSLGDTFHFAGGLQAKPPEGAEAAAFSCRALGWAAVPDDWWGSYANAGFVNSPVKSFDGAVRVYASVNGGRAYVLVLGATASTRIDWNEGFSRELVLNESGAQLYRVNR